MVQQRIVCGSSSFCRHDAFAFFGHLLLFAEPRVRFVFVLERQRKLAESALQACSRPTAARGTDQWFGEGGVGAS